MERGVHASVSEVRLCFEVRLPQVKCAVRPFVLGFRSASGQLVPKDFRETMKITTLLRSQVCAVLALTVLLALLVPGLMAQSSGTSGLAG